MTIGEHLKQMFHDGRVIGLCSALLTSYITSVAVLRLACHWVNRTQSQEPSGARIKSDVDAVASVVFVRGLLYLLGGVAAHFLVKSGTGGLDSPEIGTFSINLSHLLGVTAWVLIPFWLLSANVKNSFRVCMYECLIAGALSFFVVFCYYLHKDTNGFLPANLIDMLWADPDRWWRMANLIAFPLGFSSKWLSLTVIALSIYIILVYIYYVSCRILNSVQYFQVYVPSIWVSFRSVAIRNLAQIVFGAGLLTIGELMLGRYPLSDHASQFLLMLSVIMNVGFGAWVVSLNVDCRFTTGLKVVLVELALQSMFCLSLAFIVGLLFMSVSSSI